MTSEPATTGDGAVDASAVFDWHPRLVHAGGVSEYIDLGELSMFFRQTGAIEARRRVV